MCVCYCMSNVWGFLGGLKKVLDPLELKLCVVVNHPIWVIGTELGLLEEQQALLTAELAL